MRIEATAMKVDAALEPRVRWMWLLCCVLVLALVFRLWGIDYGLPFSYWDDEYHELMRAMELGAGKFNFARTSKGGFYLLLFVEYGIYFVVLKLAGIVANAREFAELFARDPTMFYLIGRGTAAVLGCITVAAVFWLSRLAYSTAAGLFAAFLLAINVLHIDLSHRIGVDVPMTMLAALALVFGLRVAASDRRIDYVLGGLFVGLATTTKLPGILLIVPLLVAHTYAISRRGGRLREWFVSRDLWIAASVFAAALLVTNPGFVTNTSFGNHYSPPSGDALEADGLDSAADEDSGGRPTLYLFYVNVLLESMGWPLFLVSLAAFAYAIWKRSRADVLLVSYALINFIVISSTASETLYYPRYTLPIILVLAILSGRALAELIQYLPRWRIASTVAIFAVLSVWPVSQAVTSDIALTKTDTRTMAKNWFEANVPAGAKVLIEGGKTAPKRVTVPLQDSRLVLERRIAYWQKKEPRQAKFLEFKLAVHEGVGYDLLLVGLNSLASLDEYAAAGVEYFVVRPLYFANSRRADSSAARLLRELRSDPRTSLLRRFEPQSPTQPGLLVEIYRLDPSKLTNSN